MKDLGVMQGRLSTRFMSRYQAFPKHVWQSEFYIAQDMGFKTIEFILDYNDAMENPLMSDQGLESIKQLVAQTGVEVRSICADYFMEAPLFRAEHRDQSKKVLKQLIENAAKLKVRDIVIPCVDQSTLGTSEDKKNFTDALNEFTALARENEILINLETDLGPDDFRELLEGLDTSVVKVNYDIGNSASLGYDPEEEFKAYGTLISDLHIKDRVLGGASVPLGTGNADFEKVFSLLKENSFNGNVVMQAAREEDFVEDLSLLKKQASFARKYIEKYLS